MKRAEKRSSTDSGSGEGEEKSFFLAAQNKALVKEMHKYKRQISESKAELELMRMRTREMEALVSVIQRAWSQLDVDASLLLDAFGVAEKSDQEEKLQIMKLFLSSGSQFRRKDATNMTAVYVPMKLDDWSNPKEIEAERKKSLESILTVNEYSMETDDNTEDLVTQLDEHLLSHTTFTLSLLERICSLISETGAFENSSTALQAVSQWKEWSAEKLLFEDRISKLCSEIVNLNADNQLLKIENKRANRELDKLKEEIVNLQSSSKDITPAPNTADTTTTATSGPSAQSPELLEKISVLEKQLAESESAKAKVEMTLTERLARPLAQTEAQISDMRKSMEELRQQFKQRISSLLSEGSTLQEKVFDQEVALMEIEAMCGQRCKEMADATQQEIERVRKESSAIQTKLQTALAEVSAIELMKSQIKNHEAAMEFSTAESKRLNDRIATLTKRLAEVEKLLAASRVREIKLESMIAQTHENGEVIADENFKSTVKAGIDRTREMQEELDEIKVNMDDLISEIESVSQAEKKSRQLIEKLQDEIDNNHRVHKGVLHENLQLHDKVSEAFAQREAAQAKEYAASEVARMQDSLINSIRQEEQHLRNEIRVLKKSLDEAKAARILEEQALLEAQQKCSLAEHAIETANKRNMELQARCGELGKKLEAERKQRMELQRDTKAKKKGEEISNQVTTANQMKNEDVEMLEITLGMLRCSVCRDRFKEVAIARCFHLFCKECIDETIRNRSRKCPACGERFGQDDVKTIFFTH